MNQEVLRKWVAALRSGEYTQGLGHLHNATDNTHCCLGVLSDLAVKAGILPPPIPYRISDRVTLSSYKGGYTEMPPPEVYEWVRRTNHSGTDEPVTFAKLANMNDQGRSYAEIADAIEAAWIEKEEPGNA